MAAVLARATKTPLESYADEKLFKPLGIANVAWHRDRTGVPIAASGLRMTPRDMARIGRVVLQKGRWNGRQVLPARWLSETTSLKAQTEPIPSAAWATATSCGCSGAANLTRRSRGRPGSAWAGSGSSWRPSQDVVLVMTTGNYNNRSQRAIALDVVTSALKAVRK
jgi:CubicO group peptidase (beta-lactamase class C family)